MNGSGNSLKKSCLIGTLSLFFLLNGAAFLSADYIRIKGTVVNVRQGPGTSFPILFQAEQGEEFDHLSTEGLWHRISLGPGQEAWVYGKLSERIQGDRPGGETARNIKDGGDGSLTKGSGAASLVFSFVALFMAAIFLWKRKEILTYTRRRLREISGYRREQPFRYDNRKPSDDSWEL